MAEETTQPIPELTISFLRGDTPDPYCIEYAEWLHQKFTTPAPRRPGVGAYQDGVSILMLPANLDDYWSSPSSYWLRQKVRRSERDGFTFSAVDRDAYIDDIFDINTSMAERQGRPMSAGYGERPAVEGPLPDYACPRHALRTYGILREGRLCAYAWVYVVGEMCLFSTILGHGEHLKSGIMSQLIVGVVRDLGPSAGLRYGMYNMHASGTDGLRFFKEQMGFKPFWVNWQLTREPAGNRADTLVTAARLAPKVTPLLRARRYAGKVVRTARRRLPGIRQGRAQR